MDYIFIAFLLLLLSLIPISITYYLFSLLRRKNNKAKQKERHRQRLLQVSLKLPSLIKRISSRGISSLSNVEREFLFTLSDKATQDISCLNQNELKLIETAYSNPAIFNMLQLRNSNLNNKLITSQLKGIRTTSRFSGGAAARELAEDFME